MADQELKTAARPRLDDAQLEQLGHCAGASLQRYRDGERLIEIGDRDFKFFVVVYEYLSER